MKKLFLPIMIFIAVLNCQTTMAVLSFDAKGVSEIETNTLNDRLNEEIYKTGIFILIERNQIESIIVEQGFQQSGCTTSECAVEVGGLLGAQKIIVGRISRMGLLYSVSARIVDVQTGTIDHIASVDHKGRISMLLKDGIPHLAKELMRPYGVNPLETIKEDDKSLNFIAYDDPPEPLKEIKPKYPSKAKKLGIEGTVLVETFIDKKGKVKDCFVLEGVSENSMNQAALKAIKKTRFKPAQYNGQSIGVWISIPINFSVTKN